MTVGKLWAKADSRRRMGGGKIVDKEKDKKKKGSNFDDYRASESREAMQSMRNPRCQGASEHILGSGSAACEG